MSIRLRETFLAAVLLSLSQPGTTPAASSLSVAVVGASNPVVGATVDVYAAGPAAATAIGSGQTDSSGNVSITIANPGGNVVLYAVASGGDAGYGTNSALALMNVFGTGSNYNSPIVIDELTTIASIWSMRNFLHAGGSIFGPSPGLQNAVLTVTNLSDVTHGLPSPLMFQLFNSPAKLNTLANLLAASVGTSGPSSPTCSALFSATTLPHQAAPSNTIAAAFNLANNSTLNLTSPYAVASQSSAYGPAWPRPMLNWLISVNVPVEDGGGGVFAIDSSGDLWVGATGGITKISPTGAVAPGSPFSGGGVQGPSWYAAAMAIDANGNIWIANGYPATTVSEFDSSGNPLSLDTGYEVPAYFLAGIAIDQTDHVWVTNDNPNSPGKTGNLFELDSDGAPISGSAGFTGRGLFQPGAVAIGSSGDVWVANGSLEAPRAPIPVKEGSVSRFAPTGKPLSPKKGYRAGDISYPGGIAVDNLGNVWVANQGVLIAGKLVDNVAELKPDGRPISPSKGYRGGGINRPSAIAIDGAGLVWILDEADVPLPCGGGDAAYEITVLDPNGAPISPDLGYLVASCGFTDDSDVLGLRGIAIDPSGNVWFGNGGLELGGGITGLMLELVGAATPVKTPLIGLPKSPDFGRSIDTRATAAMR